MLRDRATETEFLQKKLGFCSCLVLSIYMSLTITEISPMRVTCLNLYRTKPTRHIVKMLGERV